MLSQIGSYNPTHFERLDQIIRNIRTELEDSEWDITLEISGERLIYLNGRLNRLKARLEDGETLEPRF